MGFLPLLQKLSPLPFERYMELALYHEDYGYYARGNIPGKRGDFITAPCVHRVFGATLALQVLEVYEILDRPSQFVIVEAGAGAGYLALDILSYLENKGFSFPYYIIEPFPALRSIQEEMLSSFQGHVKWFEHFGDLPCFEGIFICNELFDALPVHVIEKRDKELYEIWVIFRENEVIEIFERITEPEILKRVSPYFNLWEDGYRAEVNLKAEEIYLYLALKMKRGLLLIIDYGYPRQDLYHPQRKAGTLLCYYKHKVVGNPYFKPGHIDITSHVDFTYLKELGERYGFLNLGFTQQAPYLASLGIDQVFLEVSEGSFKDKEALKILLLPEGFGQTHWVLAQGRFLGYKRNLLLKGFRFSNRLRLLESR
ncbi:MAG: class I SAM-dependent methyltransferase [Caldimicrobium sp.]